MKKLLILVIALFIGLSCALPDILGYLELRNSYEPFTYLFPSDVRLDEVVYYARWASYFKERLHIPWSDFCIYEYKNQPIGAYYLPIIIEGGLGYIVGSLRLAWGLIRFIFPILSFLLAYWLIKEIVYSDAVACVASVIFCTVGFGAQTFFNMGEASLAQPVIFSRISAPAVILPFFLAALLGLVKIQKKQFGPGLIIASISGGLLFYVDYFYIVTYAGTLAFLSCAYLIKKEWRAFLYIVLIGMCVNLIALPWYRHYFYLQRFSPHFISRFTAFGDKILYVGYHQRIAWAAIGILAIGYVVWRNIIVDRQNAQGGILHFGYLILYACIVTAILVQHVVALLAPVLFPRHFSQRIIINFSILIFSCLCGQAMLLYTRFSKVYFSSFIGILIAASFIKQITVWQYSKNYFKASASEQKAEQLIRRYTGVEDVIAMRNPYLNSVFPARLWRFTFYTNAGLTNLDENENLQRYFFIQKIFNQPWNYIDRELASYPDTVMPPLKRITVPYVLNHWEALVKKYREDEKINFDALKKEFIRTKKLDYIICLDPHEENDLVLGSKKLGLAVALAARDQGVSLYKLKD